MKDFVNHKISYQDLKNELEQYKRILDKQSEYSETEIVNFLKTCPNIICLISNISDGLHFEYKYAFEFPIYGDFVADCIICDNKSNYTFIEFEDAKKNSIFEKNGKKSVLEWSKKFEHGYSQIIDWFWKLDCCKSDPILVQKLGFVPNYVGILILGRDNFLTNEDSLRLKWRQENSLINSKKINIFTYDEIYFFVKEFFDNIFGIMG